MTPSGSPLTKTHEVRPPRFLRPGDGELIHHEEVVVRRILEIDQLRVIRLLLALRVGELDLHPVHQQPVKRAVVPRQARFVGVVTTCTTSSTAAGGSLGLSRRTAVGESPFQNDRSKIRPLRRHRLPAQDRRRSRRRPSPCPGTTVSASCSSWSSVIIR